MKALAEASDVPFREWDASFISDVCFRAPVSTTQRQRQMIEILCWRYRAHLPAELVPASEPPKLKARA